MTAPLLDAFTLARFRALQEGNMPSRADLYALARERTRGAVEETAPVLLATVPCRIAVTASGALPIIAAEPTPNVGYTLTMPADTDLTLVERVIVHGDTFGASWSAEMIVSPPDEPRSYSAAKRLAAKLAPDTILPVPQVETVIVSEAPPMGLGLTAPALPAAPHRDARDTLIPQSPVGRVIVSEG